MADISSELQERANQAAALQLSIEQQIRDLKAQQQDIDATWDQVKDVMIEHDIKSIKGDWGSITIAERINWECDPTVLQPKFFKKVVDTKKLTDTFSLEGKLPKGATPSYTKYLTKRIK